MLKSNRPTKTSSAEELAELFKHYRKPLLRHFVRRGLAVDAAEDCVQEVFSRIAAVHHDALESPKAYLFATATNVYIDRARRSRARAEGRHDPVEGFSLVSSDPSPARVFEGKEALAHLDTVLRELPRRTREVLLLNRLEGLTYTQLASRYGVSVGSIEKRIARALAHLHKRFDTIE